jgi:hypothetical protein
MTKITNPGQQQPGKQNIPGTGAPTKPSQGSYGGDKQTQNPQQQKDKFRTDKL